MVRALSLGAVLAALWLLLSGHLELMFLVFGAISVALAVAFAQRMDAIDREGHPIHFGRAAFLYWPWLFWEIVKSSIDVARLILNPRLPISPNVVRLATSQMSEVGRVVYANSITLTPGTVTIGIENGTFEVHAITRGMAESLMEGEMDRRVAAVEPPEQRTAGSAS